jgi:hypothetical protein
VSRRLQLVSIRLPPAVASVLAAIILAACGNAPLPLPTIPPSTVTPTPSYAPVPVRAWWAAGEPTVTTCGQPVTLWMAGKTQKLGFCASNLDDSPTPVTLHVGEQMGIHFTSDGTQWPYPPPSPSAAGVVDLESVEDKGTSFAYQATSPGTATLSARGLLCPTSEVSLREGRDMVPCSFASVTVVP